MPFRLHETYSRLVIARELGGSQVEYLPSVGGRVVCACLRRSKHNPDAPEIILAGKGSRVKQAAERLCERQQDPIPMFIKLRPNFWEYVGDYAVDHTDHPPSTNHRIIAEHEARSQRFGCHGISLVIYMRPVRRA